MDAGRQGIGPTPGVYAFNIPRAEAIIEDGMPIPVAWVPASSSNFQPTGGGKAAITGDSCLSKRGQSRAQGLARGGNLGDGAAQPHAYRAARLFFMHFWATDDAAKAGQEPQGGPGQGQA